MQCECEEAEHKKHGMYRDCILILIPGLIYCTSYPILLRERTHGLCAWRNTRQPVILPLPFGNMEHQKMFLAAATNPARIIMHYISYIVSVLIAQAPIIRRHVVVELL